MFALESGLSWTHIRRRKGIPPAITFESSQTGSALVTADHMRVFAQLAFTFT
jgi:hypothetical protein